MDDDFPQSSRDASAYRGRTIRRASSREDINKLDVDTLGPPTQVKALPWSPHLSVLLQGVCQADHPLSALKGLESTVVKDIYEMGCVDHWKQNITICPPAHAVAFTIPEMAWSNEDYAKMTNHEEGVHCYAEGQDHLEAIGQKEEDRPEVAFSLIGTVDAWPKPTGRNVNMLPFVMGDKESLPEDLRPYYDLCEKCPLSQDEYGKVLYLTVTEGIVDTDSTQRRPGLHVEAPGGMFLAGNECSWGGGHFQDPDKYIGGLYMASNLEDTTMLWDALVHKDQGIVDFHGGGEHLRPFIGKGTKLKANEIAWLTDRTPHEGLPQKKGAHRQFFRLVTSNISVWFQQHSTPNPKVPLPGFVRIIQDDKFLLADSFSGKNQQGEEEEDNSPPKAKKLKKAQV